MTTLYCQCINALVTVIPLLPGTPAVAPCSVFIVTWLHSLDPSCVYIIITFLQN